MISVIVQTLNNAATLSACLGALVPAAVDAVVTEVIVVDGGSTDATLEIVEDAGARRAASAEAAAHLQNSGGRGARFRSAQWWPLRLGDQRALLIRRDRFGKPLERIKRLNSRAYSL